MATRQQRRANVDGKLSVVQVSINRVFQNRLRELTREAVLLNQRILIEGHLLANYHVLRLLTEQLDLPAFTMNGNKSHWQTVYDRCFAAVSHSTGPGARQYKRDADPELTQSYDEYKDLLPPGHHKPTRPTWLKDVSCFQTHATDAFVAMLSHLLVTCVSHGLLSMYLMSVQSWCPHHIS